MLYICSDCRRELGHVVRDSFRLLITAERQNTTPNLEGPDSQGNALVVTNAPAGTPVRVNKFIERERNSIIVK